MTSSTVSGSRYGRVVLAGRWPSRLWSCVATPMNTPMNSFPSLTCPFRRPPPIQCQATPKPCSPWRPLGPPPPPQAVNTSHAATRGGNAASVLPRAADRPRARTNDTAVDRLPRLWALRPLLLCSLLVLLTSPSLPLAGAALPPPPTTTHGCCQRRQAGAGAGRRRHGARGAGGGVAPRSPRRSRCTGARGERASPPRCRTRPPPPPAAPAGAAPVGDCRPARARGRPPRSRLGHTRPGPPARRHRRHGGAAAQPVGALWAPARAPPVGVARVCRLGPRVGLLHLSRQLRGLLLRRRFGAGGGAGGVVGASWRAACGWQGRAVGGGLAAAGGRRVWVGGGPRHGRDAGGGAGVLWPHPFSSDVRCTVLLSMEGRVCWAVLVALPSARMV